MIIFDDILKIVNKQILNTMEYETLLFIIHSFKKNSEIINKYNILDFLHQQFSNIETINSLYSIFINLDILKIENRINSIEDNSLDTYFKRLEQEIKIQEQLYSNSKNKALLFELYIIYIITKDIISNEEYDIKEYNNKSKIKKKKLKDNEYIISFSDENKIDMKNKIYKKLIKEIPHDNKKYYLFEKIYKNIYDGMFNNSIFNKREYEYNDYYIVITKTEYENFSKNISNIIFNELFSKFAKKDNNVSYEMEYDRNINNEENIIISKTDEEFEINNYKSLIISTIKEFEKNIINHKMKIKYDIDFIDNKILELKDEIQNSKNIKELKFKQNELKEIEIQKDDINKLNIIETKLNKLMLLKNKIDNSNINLIELKDEVNKILSIENIIETNDDIKKIDEINEVIKEIIEKKDVEINETININNLSIEEQIIKLENIIDNKEYKDEMEANQLRNELNELKHSIKKNSNRMNDFYQKRKAQAAKLPNE